MENEAADALSRIGSARLEIPPEVALEHLRKPSINPAPGSTLICLDPEPGAEATPMEVDFESAWGNSRTDNPDSGTANRNSEVVSSDSGTNQSGSTEAMLVDSVEALQIEPMEIGEPIFDVRIVPEWAQPILAYLMDGTLPKDQVMSRTIVRKAKGYTIINNELYKRSVIGVLQRCIETAEGLEI